MLINDGEHFVTKLELNLNQAIGEPRLTELDVKARVFHTHLPFIGRWSVAPLLIASQFHILPLRASGRVVPAAVALGAFSWSLVTLTADPNVAAGLPVLVNMETAVHPFAGG